MSAVPLIEAVQRAGGAITLQGDRLRLSAPEPLPENLLEELRAHKAEVIDHLQHARRPELAQPATDALTNVGTLPSRRSRPGSPVSPACPPWRRPAPIRRMPGSS